MPEMYYNPTEDVFGGVVGRKLEDTDKIPRPYTHYANQLRPGELLYMGLRHGPVSQPKMVVWIYNEASYNDYYGRYFSGVFGSIDFYALPAEAPELRLTAGSTIKRTTEPFGDYPDDAVPSGFELEFLSMDKELVTVRAVAARTVHRFPRRFLRRPWFEGFRL